MVEEAAEEGVVEDGEAMVVAEVVVAMEAVDMVAVDTEVVVDMAVVTVTAEVDMEVAEVVMEEAVVDMVAAVADTEAVVATINGPVKPPCPLFLGKLGKLWPDMLYALTIQYNIIQYNTQNILMSSAQK